MRLESTDQVELHQLVEKPVDLFLAASGFESRATHLASKVPELKCGRKVALGFVDRIALAREENDRTFSQLGFEILSSSGDSGVDIHRIVSAALKNSSGPSFRLLVDYSSMTRSWYAAVIQAVLLASTALERVECFFTYSPAVFVKPPPTAPNSSVGPIEGFCGLESPDKPTALVLGLGYERERAIGLKEYVDPAIAYAFYTDPAFDDRFRTRVLLNNSDLIRSLQPENVISHPFHDLQRTSLLLASLYMGLRDRYRVILAPLGVKPFSLLCLLLASRNGDLDVWRVSAGGKAAPQPRPALGPLLTLRVCFRNDS